MKILFILFLMAIKSQGRHKNIGSVGLAENTAIFLFGPIYVSHFSDI